MTKDSYGYPTKIPTKITDLYGGDDIPSRDEIPSSDDIVEEIEEYLDVDLATEGQVITMGADGIVKWDDVASGGGINYTTEEQDTGLKWIDNNSIYQITKEINIVSGTNSYDFVTGVDRVVDSHIEFRDANNMTSIFGEYSTIPSSANSIRLRKMTSASNSAVRIETSGSVIGTCWVTVKYTKRST